MISQQRNAVYEVLQTIERLASAAASEDGRQPAPPALVGGEQLARLRSEICKQLLTLKSELGRLLTERECYLVLFPIVLTLDELVQTRYAEIDQRSWPLLQRELFSVDQGGELFYETLDEILERGLSTPLVLEVFTFCLSVGFRGKHSGDEETVIAYLGRLRGRLDQGATAAPEDSTRVSSGLIRPAGRFWWLYYVAAALLVLGLYFTLGSMASSGGDDETPALPAPSRRPASSPASELGGQDRPRRATAPASQPVTSAAQACGSTAPASQPALAPASQPAEEDPDEEHSAATSELEEELGPPAAPSSARGAEFEEPPPTTKSTAPVHALPCARPVEPACSCACSSSPTYRWDS